MNDEPKRVIIPTDQMTLLTAPQSKTWLRHYRIEHPSLPYPAEMVARSNGTYTAHKAVLIFIPPELAARVEKKGLVTLGTFFKYLRSVEDDAQLLLVEMVRPHSFFTYEDEGEPTALGSNMQLELPGGQAPGKKGFEAVLQEATEEVNLDAKQVLCWAPAFFSPTANDAGTHAERYQMWYVLCSGQSRPPTDEERVAQMSEGITKRYLIDLRDLEEVIAAREHGDGMSIEIWVRMLRLELFRGLHPLHLRRR